MSFGYEREVKGLINNSIILNAYVYSDGDQILIPAASIVDVKFSVLVPGDDPLNPTVNAVSGSIVGDGWGQYVVDKSINMVSGRYRAFGTFEYTDGDNAGLTKSVSCNYNIEDPFASTGASPADPYVQQAWVKIEDCFDSEMGGPWLRDMTLAVFDQYKIRQFIPEALLAINQQMPFTDFSEGNFPYTANDGGALMAQALLVSTLRHLMRSYTEQPDMVSSPVAFMDRKKYQSAWAAVYAIEEPLFERWLTRWKLRAYDLSSSALLLGSKAGRMIPAPMRTRYTARGF